IGQTTQKAASQPEKILLEGCPLVSQLLLRIMRWCPDIAYPPVHRAAGYTNRLMARLISPPSRGGVLRRSLDKAIGHHFHVCQIHSYQISIIQHILSICGRATKVKNFITYLRYTATGFLCQPLLLTATGSCCPRRHDAARTPTPESSHEPSPISKQECRGDLNRHGSAPDPMEFD